MDTAPQRTLHARHRNARGRTISMLIADAEACQGEDLAESPLTRRLANKLLNCGQSPIAYWSASDARLVISRGLCKSRLCPTCATHRVRRMEADIADLASEIDSPRLLTLTLRSSDDPLDAQLKRLRQCFRRLRQRKDWGRHVQGGVVVVEVTYNARRDQWHPHLHCLIDATFWPQASIADLWEEVTGDSRIVDIRVARSTSTAVKYLSKYVSKTGTPPSLPAKRIGEWATAVHGLRLFQTFGSLHARARPDEQPAKREPLEHVAPLTPLFECATHGDASAVQLVADLRALRMSDKAESHASMYARLAAWWASFIEARERRPHPACPDDAPPPHRDAALFDERASHLYPDI